MTLALRYAARSDVGLLREGNEDSAYAGPRLLALADGMGGHAYGEVASAVAIATLAPLDDDIPGSDLLTALERAIREANDQLRRMVEADRALEGMGTTLIAMLWAGSRMGLAHIGDSRAYLLRADELHQITRDHTLVQSLVDEGRISAEEAAVHPQRSLILRALDGRDEVEPDLSIREVWAGDRYLLCSDGLSDVVSEETIYLTLRDGGAPEQVVYQLIDLANRSGGPDNITCVVADVIDTADQTMPQPTETPVVVGAAGNAVRRGNPSLDTSAGRAAALTRRPQVDEDDGEPVDRKPRRRWPRFLFSFVVLAALVCTGSYFTWRYVQSQYYIGARSGEVVIFRGPSQQLAGYDLSKVHERTGIPLEDLPVYERDAVEGHIEADSLAGAKTIVSQLRDEASACSNAQRAAVAPKAGKASGRRSAASPKPTPPASPNGCSEGG